MPFDPAHFFDRFFQPFNSESRFYWPAVVAVVVSFIANIVWYNWRSRTTLPPEIGVRPWAFWTNVVFLIWYLVLLRAGVPFWVLGVSIVANLALVIYVYWTYLPPREAAWERERRRQSYFPKPGRKRKRRR